MYNTKKQKYDNMRQIRMYVATNMTIWGMNNNFFKPDHIYNWTKCNLSVKKNIFNSLSILVKKVVGTVCSRLVAIVKLHC